MTDKNAARASDFLRMVEDQIGVARVCGYELMVLGFTMEAQKQGREPLKVELELSWPKETDGDDDDLEKQLKR